MTNEERADDVCTCVTCSEDYPGCALCAELDSYEPCPSTGYGCGFGATVDWDRCECCTPEQWEQAATGSVAAGVTGSPE